MKHVNTSPIIAYQFIVCVDGGPTRGKGSCILLDGYNSSNRELPTIN